MNTRPSRRPTVRAARPALTATDVSHRIVRLLDLRFDDFTDIEFDLARISVRAQQVRLLETP